MSHPYIESAIADLFRFQCIFLMHWNNSDNVDGEVDTGHRVSGPGIDMTRTQHRGIARFKKRWGKIFN